MTPAASTAAIMVNWVMREVMAFISCSSLFRTGFLRLSHEKQYRQRKRGTPAECDELRYWKSEMRCRGMNRTTAQGRNQQPADPPRTTPAIK
jgi:hypothetical protein